MDKDDDPQDHNDKGLDLELEQAGHRQYHERNLSRKYHPNAFFVSNTRTRPQVKGVRKNRLKRLQ